MFWNRFSELCDERGIKPTPLLRKLNIAVGLVTKWKNGATPDIHSLNVLSNFFGVSIDYLLGNTDIKEKADPQKQAGANVVNEILNIYSTLTDAQKHEFLTKLEDIINKK